jgi:hypothetical protein
MKYQPAADTSGFPFQNKDRLQTPTQNPIPPPSPRALAGLKLQREVIQTEVGFHISTYLVIEFRFNEVLAGSRYQWIPIK